MSRFYNRYFAGRVAQLAEQAAHNRPVGGSSPPAPIFLILIFSLCLPRDTYGAGVWYPYSFLGCEKYLYRYREVIAGRERHGNFTINVGRNNEELYFVISGKYDRWEGRLEKRVADPVEISGLLLMRMYFEFWMIPAGKTVLSYSMVKALYGKRIDLEKRAEAVGCSYGGVEGVSLEVYGDKAVLRLCVSEGVAMPVRFYRKSGKDVIYEATLMRYSCLPE